MTHVGWRNYEAMRYILNATQEALALQLQGYLHTLHWIILILYFTFPVDVGDHIDVFPVIEGENFFLKKVIAFALSLISCSLLVMEIASYIQFVPLKRSPFIIRSLLKPSTSKKKIPERYWMIRSNIRKFE